MLLLVHSYLSNIAVGGMTLMTLSALVDIVLQLLDVSERKIVESMLILLLFCESPPPQKKKTEPYVSILSVIVLYHIFMYQDNY